MKRLLAFAIVVMMVFATVPVSVSAAGTFTGDIGSGKTYATLGDAMAAFNSASYDKVFLNVYGAITLDEGI